MAMDAPSRYYRLGSEIVLPDHGFEGGALDLDNTLVVGHNLYDHSRINAAKKIADLLEKGFSNKPGMHINLHYLRNLTIQQSQESYDKAAASTTEGSLAWILAQAEYFDSHESYDRADPILEEFMRLRQKAHLVALKDHSHLNEGAEELLRYGRDELTYGLSIATMSGNDEAAIIYDKFDFERYIPWRRVITNDDVDYAKPHREVNDRAFRTLETPSDNDEQRKRIIGIDDSVHGVRSIDGARLFPVGLAAHEEAHRLFIGSPAALVVPSLIVALDFMKRANARRS